MSHLLLLAFAPTDLGNATGSGIFLLTNTIPGLLSHFQAGKYKIYQYLANAGLIIELLLVIGLAALEQLY